MPLLPTSVIAGVCEAGCDEAGRGCIAGPVYAAAVILPDGFTHPLLDDSKKISDRQRRLMVPVIKSQAIAWAIGTASAAEIDEINILRASILAMHRALDGLGVIPDHIAVDGNRFSPWRPMVDYTTVIKGDGRFADIAAASILAKTARDDEMIRLHEQYPLYGWDINKGYPTPAHRAAVAAHGPSPLHRMTFTLLPGK